MNILIFEIQILDGFIYKVYISLNNAYRESIYTPRKTKFLGGYIGLTLSVRLSVRRQISVTPLFFITTGQIDFNFGMMGVHMEKVCHDFEFFRLTSFQGHRTSKCVVFSMISTQTS